MQYPMVLIIFSGFFNFLQIYKYNNLILLLFRKLLRLDNSEKQILPTVLKKILQTENNEWLLDWFMQMYDVGPNFPFRPASWSHEGLKKGLSHESWGTTLTSKNNWGVTFETSSPQEKHNVAIREFRNPHRIRQPPTADAARRIHPALPAKSGDAGSSLSDMVMKWYGLQFRSSRTNKFRAESQIQSPRAAPDSPSGAATAPFAPTRWYRNQALVLGKSKSISRFSIC